MEALTNAWFLKLRKWGVPEDLASRAASDLAIQGLSPDLYPDAATFLGDPTIQAFDWFDDIQDWIGTIIEWIKKLLPGGVLIAGGALISSFLSGVKIKGVPLSVVGIVPIGMGLYMWYQQLQELFS